MHSECLPTSIGICAAFTQGNPSRYNSFNTNEGIQSVFHQALVSVQPLLKKIHPGTTPFIRIMAFRVFSIKHWNLCSLYSKEIHPGTTPFIRMKAFRVFSINHLYLCSLYFKEIHLGAAPFIRMNAFRVFTIKHWFLCSLYSRKSIQVQLFSYEWRDSEGFPSSIGICVAFTQRKSIQVQLLS